MPCLRILTNIPISQVPKDFVNKILPLLAKVVRKPEDKFLCVVSGDCHISFAGQASTPSAVATLESIGHLGVDENKVITREVTAFIEKELGIPPNHFFLSFYDLKGQNIGKGGVTLA
ncbi:MIF-like protein mif-2 [Helicoverpa zea]|uniref:MIF-like protein mif-2 n=1 Tax=Helicoverpa zea TaxID=7113 RepID=UPI001F57F863|nr:MIF-like protein mif-2 [Helicoverpa zea]